MMREGWPDSWGRYVVRFEDGAFGLATRTLIPLRAVQVPSVGLVEITRLGWLDVWDEHGVARAGETIVAFDDSEDPSRRTCDALGPDRHVALTRDLPEWEAACTWCGWNDGGKKPRSMADTDRKGRN